tara:strand:+ start:43 stop:228 length:186 start_codon:yes stop_codon:yes gene_type:complete
MKKVEEITEVQETEVQETPEVITKTLLLTTDGKNIQVTPENLSVLEIEMMLTKALNYIQTN